MRLREEVRAEYSSTAVGEFGVEDATEALHLLELLQTTIENRQGVAKSTAIPKVAQQIQKTFFRFRVRIGEL